MLVSIPGIEDVGMTTNGIGLARMAAELRAAGLRRMNVSLDTIDRDVFKKLTRRDALDDVMEGLAAAAEAGFHPIKVNSVVMRGVNDHEIVPLARLARDHGFVLRFIEFMPIGMGDGWTKDAVMTNAEVLGAAARDRPARTRRRTGWDGAGGAVAIHRRAGRDRAHRQRHGAVLRPVQSHPHHRGRKAAHVSLFDWSSTTCAVFFAAVPMTRRSRS